MEQLDDFLSAWPAPKYPFTIDENLAKAGAPIYTRLCAECHDQGAPRTNRLIPIAEIKTDRERMEPLAKRAALDRPREERVRRRRELGILVTRARDDARRRDRARALAIRDRGAKRLAAAVLPDGRESPSDGDVLSDGVIAARPDVAQLHREVRGLRLPRIA